MSGTLIGNNDPNTLDGGCPFVVGDADGAFVDVPQAVAAGSKVRELSASFDDHFSQVTLFVRSLSGVERQHLARAYTFELGKRYQEAARLVDRSRILLMTPDVAHAWLMSHLAEPAVARFLAEVRRPVLEKPFVPEAVRRFLDQLEPA